MYRGKEYVDKNVTKHWIHTVWALPLSDAYFSKVQEKNEKRGRRQKNTKKVNRRKDGIVIEKRKIIKSCNNLVLNKIKKVQVRQRLPASSWLANAPERIINFFSSLQH